MERRPIRHVIVLLVALVLAACGGGDDTGTTAPADTGTPADTATPTETEMTTETASPTGTAAPASPATGAGTSAVTVETASTDLGTILVDGEGMTLYVFDNDSEGESTCYDSCAENWPPLTGEATAGGEVDASLLGTTERTDGSVQVTYGGMPLYYFAADTGPGDTNGQAVGDVWWVVGADGEPIRAAATSTDGAGY